MRRRTDICPGVFIDRAPIPRYTSRFLKLYDDGKISHESAREAVGEVLYNRGIAAAIWTAEAIRTAMKIHGTNEVRASMSEMVSKPLTWMKRA